MILYDKNLSKMYNSLLYLESLDRHYYKKEDFKLNQFKNKLKSKVVDTEDLKTFNTINRSFYSSNYDLDTYNNIQQYLLDNGLLKYISCYRFNDSYYQKTKRLKLKITRLFNYDNLFFLTFTFNDKKLRKPLNDYSMQYLRRLITNFLNKYCIDYVGNVDYGGKNGRIHFHCVCSSTHTRILHKWWKYGALKSLKINNKNSTAISLYINKLSSHALKESTHNQYLIYPKKKS